MTEWIDLRSDTVTRPTPEMREAMMKAEVGDDVYMEDPTVNHLQERAAEIFGREAALFVPSGTMGNQIAVKSHTHHGQEVILEEAGHIFNYELATMSAFSGVMPRPIAGHDGVITWNEIKTRIRPKIYYLSHTGLVALENTHNMAGGSVFPQAVADEVCDRAHESGIPVHLDGARIFNASIATGKSVVELTQKFDSVMFCLSKGLGAPVGSLLLGSRELIERARVYRKAMGGGMRQVGVLAAAGLVALEKHPAKLHEDHANAKHLAKALAEMPGIQMDPSKVQTNILVFDISGTGQDTSSFSQALRKHRVLANGINPTHMRMVTHYDVHRDDIEKTIQAIHSILETP
ncbi:MAG: low-specificity L-threonine aldolase [Acidobacteriia bacterium]|nr:low-specificity L-threonine aldolase [Terriglobia bacterium]